MARDAFATLQKLICKPNNIITKIVDTLFCSRANGQHIHSCKIVLREKYTSYDNALMILNMESLQERREALTLKFAKSGIKHNKLNDLLPLNKKSHVMNTRSNEQYKVEFANTERLKSSCIPAIQRKLNDDITENRKRKCG